MFLYFCVIVVLLAIVIYQLNKRPSCEVSYRVELFKYKPNRSTTIAGPTLGIGGGKKVSTNGSNVYLGADFSVARIEKKIRIYDNVNFKTGLNLNANTKASIGADGISGSILGFGASLGRDSSLKTPLGSLGLIFK